MSKTLLWLIGLFLLSTLISQSAMDLFSGLIVLTVLGIWIGRREPALGFKSVFEKSGLEPALLAWFLAVGLSFALSPVIGTDWAARLAGFKWVLVMYALAWAITQIRPTNRSTKMAAILLSVCSAYAIFVYFLGRDPINPEYDLAPWAGGHRTGGFLSNAMTFAHVYGVYFCLFVGFALHNLKRDVRESAPLIAAIALTAFALVLSFTRGVWMALAVSVLVMGFIYKPKIGAFLSLTGAAVLAALLGIWPALRERLSQFSLAGDERSWIWAGHWKIFTDHPWTGVGYTENVRIIPDYYDQIGAPAETIVSHAHNQYLQWLAGTGVVGLAAYLFFIVMILRLSWKTYQRIPVVSSAAKGLALGCLGAQICFLVGGLTEANFEHSKMKYVMLIIWATVIALSRLYPSQEFREART